MTLSRRALLSGLGTVALSAPPIVRSTAIAQPAGRPLRIVYPFAAGGTGDAIARLVADRLAQILNIAVIVENRAGASGRTATKSIVTSEIDGLTLLYLPAAVPVLLPILYQSATGYDPIADLKPISQLATFTSSIVTSNATQVSSVGQLVDWLKANPDKATYGLAGGGGIHHFTALLFARKAGLDVTNVNYRGSGPVMNDLVAGQIPFAFVIASEAIELHKSGKVRMLATTGAARSAVAKDVPTLREQGFDITAEGWYAMFAPAKAPADMVARYAKALQEVMRQDDIRKRIVGFGADPTGTTPERMAAIMRSDIALWRPIIEASGYKPGQ